MTTIKNINEAYGNCEWYLIKPIARGPRVAYEVWWAKTDPFTPPPKGWKRLTVCRTANAADNFCGRHAEKRGVIARISGPGIVIE